MRNRGARQYLGVRNSSDLRKLFTNGVDADHRFTALVKLLTAAGDVPAN